MFSRYFFAIVLILLGIGFLLGQLNIWNFSEVFGLWWPIIIVVAGLVILIQSRKSVLPGLIVLIIGLIFLADAHNIYQGSFWDAFWPIILILIGIGLLTGYSRKLRLKPSMHNSVNCFVVFGGEDKIIDSEDFQGGNITTYFGGTCIDLRNAKIKSGKALIDLSVAFGGVEILVPENWKIHAKGFPFLGAFENKAYQVTDETSPILEISYFVMFGGIEVYNNPKKEHSRRYR
jgi:predicted membrane protein